MAYAIILSGGVGSRMKDTSTPKQYKEYKGMPVIGYCLKKFEEHDQIQWIYIAAEEEWHFYLKDFITKNDISKFAGFTLPGKTRQYSILNSLKEMRKVVRDDDVIVIHDAARPFVSKDIISECINLSAQEDGAMPVLSVKDTVYYSEDGKEVTALIDRARVYAGQSPESFRFGKYYLANINMEEHEFLKVCGSTEPAIISGMKIKLVEGDEKNFKITTPSDFERFIQICGEEEEE